MGSHVCIHLNASLLPTPFLDRTETLSFLAVQNRGGLGASQYFHSFSDMGRQDALSAISLSSHPRSCNSVLLCLGAVAMHPPTFCSLIRAYTYFYERDLRAHKDFLEEKRPDKKTRPANYKARYSAKEPQHGFLIVQHLHDRRSPWSLSPITQQGDLPPHSP